MTMRRSSSYFFLSSSRRSQYSNAMAGSWIEQGPITTMSLLFSSTPWTTSTASLRELMTVSLDFSV